MLKKEISNGKEMDFQRLVLSDPTMWDVLQEVMIHEKDRVVVVRRRVVDDGQDHGHGPHGGAVV